MNPCIEARPNMIATLNSFRDTLEDSAGLRHRSDGGAGRLSPEIVRGHALIDVGVPSVVSVCQTAATSGLHR